MARIENRIAMLTSAKRALILKRMATTLAVDTPATSNLWLSRTKPKPGAGLRLFCVPFAGGDPSAFAGWENMLPEWLEFCAILLPGRSTRIQEPSYTDIVPLVQSLGESLQGMLDKPFALFGYSTGALICFELARWLRTMFDIQPIHLFVSACGAPQLPGRTEPIHSLSEPAFIERLRRFQGISDGLLEEPELREILLRILRADFQLTETYVYRSEKPLACPITAIGGEADPFVTRSSLRAWQAQTATNFNIHTFQGGHMFLRSCSPSLRKFIVEELRDSPAAQRALSPLPHSVVQDVE
jgi:medium-chain acyl-[acyl-carrier-protein] hydrolase